MNAAPIPAQVISLCGADGGISPLRFRFEDEQHRLHTLKIAEILDVRPVTYVGIEAFRYICKTVEQDASHVYELCYTVRSHRWCLQRKIY